VLENDLADFREDFRRKYFKERGTLRGRRTGEVRQSSSVPVSRQETGTAEKQKMF
jgi:hypothetical protein